MLDLLITHIFTLIVLVAIWALFVYLESHSSILLYIYIDTYCFVFSNPVAGESGLDRFACGVGGKIVFPHVHRTIPLMLKNGMCSSLLLFLYHSLIPNIICIFLYSASLYDAYLSIDKLIGVISPSHFLQFNCWLPVVSVTPKSTYVII